jgi:hypothetical protein
MRPQLLLFSLAWSPDAGLLATAFNNPLIRLWHTASGAVVAELAGFHAGWGAIARGGDGWNAAGLGGGRSDRLTRSHPLGARKVHSHGTHLSSLFRLPDYENHATVAVVVLFES